MPSWSRKHDLPGSAFSAPTIEYPTSLEEVIAVCQSRPAGQRMHAAGSHWALSDAALSDHIFVETHDPRNQHVGMAQTLHEVIPNCMNEAFLTIMADRNVPPFEENDGSTTPYFVHVETGKRVYQLYAELDQNAEDDPDGLARRLFDMFDTRAYFGPWAFRTLGGAGGQTVFGALTTGTHGGDFRQPPIADSVAALHVVSDGGKHYWLEPALQPEGVVLTDDDRLKDLYGDARFGGAGNFEIIRDDDVFNAALVSVGRFGVVYSIVLRAVRQYTLHERVRLGNWQTVRPDIAKFQSTLYTSPLNNRFLQVAVCLTSYAMFTRNLCGVTQRWNVPYNPALGSPNGRDERVGAIVDAPTPQRPWPLFEFAGTSHAYAHDPADPNKGAEVSFLESACMNADFMIGVLEEVCDEVQKFLGDHQVEVGTAIAAVAVIAGTAGLLAIAAALAIILLLLLAIVAAMRAGGGGQRLGQVLDDVRSQVLDRTDPAERAAGVFVWQLIAYKLFQSQQEDNDYDAVSYAIMDRHDYLDLSCNVNVDSIEVFFKADDPMLLAFVDALIAFEAQQEFNGKAFVGYAALRFTGKTASLIGPQRWDHTCVVEIAGLKDVNGVTELIDYALTLSRNPNFKGILHWGQRNTSSVEDIELRFGDRNDPRNGSLGRWREVLDRIAQGSDGFSSAFTRQTGLEVI